MNQLEAMGTYVPNVKPKSEDNETNQIIEQVVKIASGEGGSPIDFRALFIANMCDSGINPQMLDQLLDSLFQGTSASTFTVRAEEYMALNIPNEAVALFKASNNTSDTRMQSSVLSNLSPELLFRVTPQERVYLRSAIIEEVLPYTMRGEINLDKREFREGINQFNINDKFGFQTTRGVEFAHVMPQLESLISKGTIDRIQEISKFKLKEINPEAHLKTITSLVLGFALQVYDDYKIRDQKMLNSMFNLLNLVNPKQDAHIEKPRGSEFIEKYQLLAMKILNGLVQRGLTPQSTFLQSMLIMYGLLDDTKKVSEKEELELNDSSEEDEESIQDKLTRENTEYMKAFLNTTPIYFMTDVISMWENMLSVMGNAEESMNGSERVAMKLLGNLNTFLKTIGGMLQILLMHWKAQDKSRIGENNIPEEEMKKLIEDFLEVTKNPDGSITLHMTENGHFKAEDRGEYEHSINIPKEMLSVLPIDITKSPEEIADAIKAMAAMTTKHTAGIGIFNAITSIVISNINSLANLNIDMSNMFIKDVIAASSIEVLSYSDEIDLARQKRSAPLQQILKYMEAIMGLIPRTLSGTLF